MLICVIYLQTQLIEHFVLKQKIRRGQCMAVGSTLPPDSPAAGRARAAAIEMRSSRPIVRPRFINSVAASASAASASTVALSLNSAAAKRKWTAAEGSRDDDKRRRLGDADGCVGVDPNTCQPCCQLAVDQRRSNASMMMAAAATLVVKSPSPSPSTTTTPPASLHVPPVGSLALNEMMDSAIVGHWIQARNSMAGLTPWTPHFFTGDADRMHPSIAPHWPWPYHYYPLLIHTPAAAAAAAATLLQPPAYNLTTTLASVASGRMHQNWPPVYVKPAAAEKGASLPNAPLDGVVQRRTTLFSVETLLGTEKATNEASKSDNELTDVLPPTPPSPPPVKTSPSPPCSMLMNSAAAAVIIESPKSVIDVGDVRDTVRELNREHNNNNNNNSRNYKSIKKKHV